MQLTQELTARISKYIIENNLQAEDLLFKGDSKRYGETYRRFRNRLGIKLKDPSIKSIRLYDLRHYYITKMLRKINNAEIVSRSRLARVAPLPALPNVPQKPNDKQNIETLFLEAVIILEL